MMMYTVITTVVSIMIKCFIVMYYLDTTIDYKYSQLQSHLVVLAGYIVYCGFCLNNLVVLNISVGVIMEFLIIYLGYNASVGRAVIQTILLSAISMFSELMASLVINVQIGNPATPNLTITNDIVYTAISLIIFFVLVVVLKAITSKKNSRQSSPLIIAIIILPISTCAFLSLFNQLHGTIDKNIEYFYMGISIMLIISNFVIYIVYEMLMDRNIKIQMLQNIRHKEDLDSKSYLLMKEKYDELRIMAHDFNKYCSNIEVLLTENQSEALSLTHSIKNKSKDFLLVEYTNNKALNILLSQKMTECHKNNIDFQLYVKDMDLSFIEELDAVAIFANLMDNAIESCKTSKIKKIFFSIKNLNNNYIVVNVENSSDNEPIIMNNRLLSSKKDKQTHGIGFTSITKHLEKYCGRIRWNYNKNTHMFNTIIMINYSDLKELHHKK